eukprot:6203991-Pleurochrysis_carterae.AAC.4
MKWASSCRLLSESLSLFPRTRPEPGLSVEPSMAARRLRFALAESGGKRRLGATVSMQRRDDRCMLMAQARPSSAPALYLVALNHLCFRRGCAVKALISMANHIRTSMVNNDRRSGAVPTNGYKA